MAREVSNQDSDHKSEDVHNRGHVEIKVGSSLEAVVNAEKKGDENAREDYVTQWKFNKVVCGQSLFN